MHTWRQFVCDTPLGLVTFLGKFQTACDGSGLNKGTAVTLLQYFFASCRIKRRVTPAHRNR